MVIKKFIFETFQIIVFAETPVQILRMKKRKDTYMTVGNRLDNMSRILFSVEWVTLKLNWRTIYVKGYLTFYRRFYVGWNSGANQEEENTFLHSAWHRSRKFQKSRIGRDKTSRTNTIRMTNRVNHLSKIDSNPKSRQPSELKTMLGFTNFSIFAKRRNFKVVRQIFLQLFYKNFIYFMNM
jgi:hypothetical protein